MEINLTEQEIELLQKELGYIIETETRSATTKTIINNILNKLDEK